MGRIKDKKGTSVKLVHFVMIYSTREAFRSKGIHPHNMLGFCGWSLPWTCIHLWPPAKDHRLQVSKAAIMISAYVPMHMDVSAHVCLAACHIHLYISVIIFILPHLKPQFSQSTQWYSLQTPHFIVEHDSQTI